MPTLPAGLLGTHRHSHGITRLPRLYLRTKVRRWHRDLRITQPRAFMLGRIHVARAYETYIGGKEKNKHAPKRQNAGRGTVAAVVGARSRDRRVTAVVRLFDKPAALARVRPRPRRVHRLHRRGRRLWPAMPRFHSVGEYVRGEVGIDLVDQGLPPGGTWHHATTSDQKPKGWKANEYRDLTPQHLEDRIASDQSTWGARPTYWKILGSQA